MFGPGSVGLVGILNVTPDSFSDGGLFYSAERAVQRGLELVEQGADLVDVGGESTRPGSQPVDQATELRRVIPVVLALSRVGVRVSIDTQKPEVARQACASGAVLVNDVSGLRDPEMIRVVVEAGVAACVMHMRGTPAEMQRGPSYQDVVRDVGLWLAERVEQAVGAGLPRRKISVDPGIGFGKTVGHNLNLVGSSRVLEARTGCAVLIGASRKSFLGTLTGRDPAEREAATIASTTAAVLGGARLIRVHQCAGNLDAAKVALALLAAREVEPTT